MTALAGLLAGATPPGAYRWPTAPPSYDAGLTTRPVAETARDTLAWLREQADAPRTGLTREREQAVLAAWRES